MLVGGATVRPDVCPQPTAGATVRLVCAFSSPLLRAGFTVGWAVWATCTLPGLWCWGSGILAGVDWQGAQGQGGAGSARFSFGDPLREGPCSTGRESDPPEGWICRSTALGVCAVQARSMMGTSSLWILAGGWAREMALASVFVPSQAELCRQRLNNSPSRCPPALLFSEQSC